MKHILFVALSHELQPKQVEDLKVSLGIEPENIVLLSDVNPELSEQCKQVDPNSTLEQVKELAATVVVEACKVNATHFYCQGEPTLAMWANIIAGGLECHQKLKPMVDWSVDGMRYRFLHLYNWKYGIFKCIVSTTRRESIDVVQSDGSVKKNTVFNHIVWRNLF